MPFSPKRGAPTTTSPESTWAASLGAKQTEETLHARSPSHDESLHVALSRREHTDRLGTERLSTGKERALTLELQQVAGRGAVVVSLTVPL